MVMVDTPKELGVRVSVPFRVKTTILMTTAFPTRLNPPTFLSYRQDQGSV